MSLKDEVKQELKQDEELLVKVFKLEKFVRKYKKVIILTAVILALILIGYKVYDYISFQKMVKENEAFNKLLQNPNDKEALKIVKENKNLYNLYLLQKGDYKDIESKLLSEIKAYELAMQKGTKQALEDFLLNPNYKILKNPVRLALMRIYLSEGNRKKAKEIFNDINPNSQYKKLGVYLLHYGIVK